MVKSVWREYLKGEHIIRDENAKVQIRHEIRKKARESMSDLLLIYEKADECDRALIFNDPEINKELVGKLLKALMESQVIRDKRIDKALGYAKMLKGEGISYDLKKLMRSESYQRNMLIEYHRKVGKMRRKEATKFVDRLLEKKYPSADLSPMDSPDDVTPSK